ncbi:MAG: SpoIIE family protein phosphatase [bacterium]|nr:SpoIIE family protein phosphatase [bacterium]MDY2830097.1 SpoIIE family protein phosphatase [Alphaproteobacteria bacterium]
MSDSLFIEIGSHQEHKATESCFGDSVLSEKLPEEQRIISVLSDGLGSGVKANILSSMTTRMAMKFVESDLDLVRSAEVMMQALPVCQVRKISYATFSVVDAMLEGKTRIYEMDNPQCFIIRDCKQFHPSHHEISSPNWKDRIIHVYQLTAQEEDRIIIMSDGVTQAGLGNPLYPLGWQREGVWKFIENQIRRHPTISAYDLAKAIVHEALDKEPDKKAGDDISCTVIYFRKPRKLLLLSGPPFDEEKDKEIAEMIDYYDGKTAICGGTTANIIERELCLTCEMDKTTFDPNIPMASIMPGIDLVTEGILTLTEVYRMLKEGIDEDKDNAATRLAHLLLESDHIDFVIGTKINEAHQDPNLPMELDIRRNIVKKIFRLLQSKFLKEISVKYV